MGFFDKLKAGLGKTRKEIVDKIEAVTKIFKKIDEDLFDEIEEILITADVGVSTTLKIMEELRKRVKERKLEDSAELKNVLKEIVMEILTKDEAGSTGVVREAATTDAVGGDSDTIGDTGNGATVDADIAGGDATTDVGAGGAGNAGTGGAAATGTRDDAGAGGIVGAGSVGSAGGAADTMIVMTIIGVNGVGKTTSIGKIANLFREEGKQVLLAAGDTFRAAAIDQLDIWANRAGVDIIKNQEGTDPAAIVFDAASAAKARKCDVLICDTAGRLQTKKNLMNELEKIQRVLLRELPNAKKETLIVLDATAGQNAVTQAKVFNESCGIDGIILTKLDGTAKGGIIIAIKDALDIPVKYVGVGEKIDDLRDFVAVDFVNALFGD